MKNLLISGVVGLLFISGGFFLGFRLVPKPAPKPVAASHAVAAAVPVPPKPAFSIDTLKAATDGLCDLNQAIQAREQAVTAREQKAAQLEQELGPRSMRRIASSSCSSANFRSASSSSPRTSMRSCKSRRRFIPRWNPKPRSI
jgi:hypothetical protein